MGMAQCVPTDTNWTGPDTAPASPSNTWLGEFLRSTLRPEPEPEPGVNQSRKRGVTKSPYKRRKK